MAGPAGNSATGRLTAAVAAFAVMAVACTSADADRAVSPATLPPTATTRAPPAGAAGVTAPGVPPNLAFDEYLERALIALVNADPEFVTESALGTVVGDTGNDRLTDVSPPAKLARVEVARTLLTELNTYDPAALDPDQMISAAALRWHLDDIDAGKDFLFNEYATSFITGVHAALPEFLQDAHPVRTADDAAGYIARLRSVGRKIDQVMAWIDRSEELGMRVPERVNQIAAFQARGVTAGPATSNPLATTFESRLATTSLNAEDRQLLVDDAVAALSEVVYPAYERLIRRIERMETRPDEGVHALPGGEAYYRWTLRHHIGLDIDPGTVHDIGLREVERLQSDMTTALVELGYDPAAGMRSAIATAERDAGSWPLTTDAERAAMLDVAAEIIDRATQAAGAIFRNLPSTPLEVIRPPPYREGGAGAYYRPPPIDGSRPGQYYLSLGTTSFGKLRLSTTTYHEAMPGHHLQLATQAESSGLPTFQRVLGTNGFAEGWALYAERVAWELGLYADDPYGNIGRIQLELLRAARAVVDTGIHWLGWDRDEAIDYLIDTVGYDQGSAAAEIDRYLAWPGQAPSYILGMVVILGLRDDAMAAPADEFDLAAFHNEVLRHGSLPLEVLRQAIAAYIAAAV